MQTNAVDLSVCIPTYNFGRFIGETLRSILVQVRPGVEVVVLDSGSTDETAAVVQQLQAAFGCVRYVRTDKPEGIDRDMARVVQLAKGEYCWLFSADDVMNEGALDRVLVEIRSRRDVYLCVHSDNALDMGLITARHPVLALQSDAEFQLDDLGQRREYFALARTTEAFFSFMSSLIVRKAAWDRVPLDEEFVGSCWAHVARFFEMMKTGLTMTFLANALLQRRGENDSFAAQGVVRRYGIAIFGFQRLAERFWGHRSLEALHIRRALRNEFGVRAFLHAKRLCFVHPEREDILILNRMFDILYSDRFASDALCRVIYRVFPSACYGPLRSTYNALVGAVRRGSYRA